MSLLAILKTAGNDLSHVGGWVEEGLKGVGTILGVLDPPLAPIIQEVETILTDLQATMKSPINSATIQAVATSVATLAAIKLPTGTLTTLTSLINPAATTPATVS